MKLAAVTVTYKRPQQLAALIGCFLAQDLGLDPQLAEGG
jgi:hypothetical protein